MEEEITQQQQEQALVAAACYNKFIYKGAGIQERSGVSLLDRGWYRDTSCERELQAFNIVLHSSERNKKKREK